MMLEARGVTKSFGETKVLEGIDLQVSKGDVVAILGPSGSGKTTFLRCLNFLERADSGTLIFDGESVIEKKELAHVEKAYQKIDFSVITACGECCTGCAKKKAGECPGCIEADGFVPEWAESGRCRIHTCAKEHGVDICSLCREFPCDRIPEMIPWNPGIIAHLTYLKDEYERQNR